MDDLVTWLRARLDEDERVALAVNADDWREATEPGNFNEWNPTEIDHVRLHAPARVLAEVEAKRRILEAVQRYLDPHPGQACTNVDDPWQECELHVAVKGKVGPYAARLLAQPYAARPGYKEEWRT